MTMTSLMFISLTQHPIKKRRKRKPCPSHRLLPQLPLKDQVPNRSFARDPICPNSMLQRPHPRLHQQGILRQKLHPPSAHSANPSTKPTEPRTFKRRIKIDIPGYTIFVTRKEIDQVMKTMIQGLCSSPQMHGKHSPPLKNNTGTSLLCTSLILIREVKQNLWDTVLFFQKGKFFELYENDATIGHQKFDLKLTDRTNMRSPFPPNRFTTPNNANFCV